MYISQNLEEIFYSAKYIKDNIYIVNIKDFIGQIKKLIAEE